VFARAERRVLVAHLRAAGAVEVDERKLAEVTLKYEAYAQKLMVAETGRSVRQGEPLLVVYSADLLAAEEQLVNARRSGAAQEIVDASARRLTQWDLTKEQIATVEREGRADGRATIFSPAAGVVLDKTVVEGARLMAGTSLYRIGNLGRVWVQAAVDELDAAKVSVDQPAAVTLPSIGSEPLPAKVTFVAPVVDRKTRTLEARLELVNPKLLLKPGMLADVGIDAPLGERLCVPDSAILWSGEHRYAFVDRGEGRLQAVEVQTGAQAGGFTEVLNGLEAGDPVATQATFLLSSEAKLRDALPKWSAP
jgi:Cu(I)/Ag(I) efflux system membrane fusion protein